MPISRREDVVREITMMVRKGTIQFDLNDRPVLDLTRTDGRTGRRLSYCIGSIGRDDDAGGLSYTLYTTDGTFVPSSSGPRTVDSLYAGELVSLRDSVARYLDMSVNRARNLRDITEFLVGFPGGYDFGEQAKPTAFVDPDLDGNLVEVKVDGLYYPDPAVHSDSSLLFSASGDGGRKVSGPVRSLNDRAVTNIVVCLGIDRKRSLVEARGQEESAGRTKDRPLKMSI